LNNINRVASIDIKYIQVHTQSQIAEVTQRLAAVVKPFVLNHIFIITHAQINQIHETTCAAILEGSHTFEG